MSINPQLFQSGARFCATFALVVAVGFLASNFADRPGLILGLSLACTTALWGLARWRAVRIARTGQAHQDASPQTNALQNLTDEVYIIDTRSLRVAYANHAAILRHGWDDGTANKQNLAKLLPPQDLQIFRTMMEKLTRSPVTELRRRFEMKDRPYELTLKLLSNQTGEQHVLAVLHDLTEMEAADRKKSEFMATVSHELRSPLTSINGALSLVLSGATGEIPAMTRKTLEIVMRNSERLVLIVNDFLDLEKIAAGQMAFDLAPENVLSVVEEAVHLNEPYAMQHKVRVIVEPADQPLFAQLDRNRTLQALTNLLTNAIKFSPPGAVVRVTVAARAGRPSVMVTDEGRGIPAQEQGKIFQRFSQIANGPRNLVGSTGLGLSIVKAIIEQQGGTVGFESKEGAGSRFHFNLPACNPPAQLQDIKLSA